jgi:hypothetical protein
LRLWTGYPLKSGMEDERAHPEDLKENPERGGGLRPLSKLWKKANE